MNTGRRIDCHGPGLPLKAVFRALAAPIWTLLGIALTHADQRFETSIHHQLTVELSPPEQRLRAEDLITLDGADLPPGGPIRFWLHAGLKVESADPRYRVRPLTAPDSGHPNGGQAPRRGYSLSPTDGAWPDTPRPRLRYAGRIHHALIERSENYARDFSSSAGLIDDRGVALFGGSYWVPGFGDTPSTFRLTVTLPGDWDAVSQGMREGHERLGDRSRVVWASPEPMESIYLVAGRYHEYTRSAGGVVAQAFLRRPDPELASRYLEATQRYIGLYSRLLGPYPYGKFALVENFWETGFGMPSFTLLGPRVIRLPFILDSSYPHEILHNWWGNGVYVDYVRGNWSEGLTAYLADHLLKEQRGQGADYRRDILTSYRNYVQNGKDFPLTAFRGRHSSASQAVGYGKSLMLWHMLRLHLGNAAFVQGLQQFYRQYLFQRASFEDIKRVFSAQSDTDLKPFFAQWVERIGAPRLSLRGEALAGNRVRVTVRQEQSGKPYRLDVPIAVTVAGLPEARLFTLDLTGRETTVELELPAPALRIDLDPDFDVFRRLDQAEIPPALSELFGAERVTLVLPDEDDAIAPSAWRRFADSWSRGDDNRVRTVAAEDLGKLPRSGALWILGRSNRWRGEVLAALSPEHRARDRDVLVIDQRELPLSDHSIALAVRDPDRSERVLGWISADRPAALPGLARKLPHYGKYSYVGFVGDAPNNVARGQWPVTNSPLAVALDPPGASAPVARAALPSRPPLAHFAASLGGD